MTDGILAANLGSYSMQATNNFLLRRVTPTRAESLRKKIEKSNLLTELPNCSQLTLAKPHASPSRVHRAWVLDSLPKCRPRWEKKWLWSMCSWGQLKPGNRHCSGGSFDHWKAVCSPRCRLGSVSFRGKNGHPSITTPVWTSPLLLAMTSLPCSSA